MQARTCDLSGPPVLPCGPSAPSAVVVRNDPFVANVRRGRSGQKDLNGPNGSSMSFLLRVLSSPLSGHSLPSALSAHNHRSVSSHWSGPNELKVMSALKDHPTACLAGMSRSAFHVHFQEATGLTFCQYLNAADSSIVHNFVVEGGARSEAEIRQGDYLEVVEFSSFQVDPMGGDIAGEIRLGYLHRGGQIRIVSGGSVTGQMADAIPSMEFSAETEQYDNYVIPRVTLLKNLKITGIA